MPSLQGRRILLGVTGGIAAYKAADLVRRLRDAGAEVQVVLTDNAARFITPLTLQALSGNPVRNSLWDEHAEAAMGHIELARWPDAIVIAPASADTLARITLGLAPDLLSTLCLATDRPLLVAPAMNRLMWTHPATVQNLRTLRQRGVHVVGPGSGSQACGETGEGRMSEPLEIVAAAAALLGDGPLTGRHAVITAGPTQEPLDPVRVLSNRSSGKMGFAVAAALAGLGARVSLIAGPVHLDTPAGVERHDVETAADMLDAALRLAPQAELFIGAAAVADYRPAQAANSKIKKAKAELTLPLERTTDILSAVREAHPELFMVGFAAETENLEAYAQDKLRRKGLQMIAANLVGGGRAFDRDDNSLQVWWPDGGTDLGSDDKTALARRLAALIADRLDSFVPPATAPKSSRGGKTDKNRTRKTR